jgi:hypothetical protein
VFFKNLSSSSSALAFVSMFFLDFSKLIDKLNDLLIENLMF